MTDTLPDSRVWPKWRKIAFRFAFIYLLLYMQPWNLVGLPYFGYVTQWPTMGWDWMVRFANAHWFNVADELVPFNGSGDTSFGYAQLILMVVLGVIGTAIWSVADNKRNNYERLDYWTRVVTRYYIAYYCFVYGIIKIYMLQMIFPNVSQLATPLGDFLPMRFSWLFIGYSGPYQVFSGIMETIAGLLLLNRKTVTLGLVTATGVFLHVFVLNLSYDIPVKLFSGHLLLFSIFLLTYETKRLTDFFIFNRVADPDRSFEVTFTKRWMQWARIGAKLLFVVLMVVIPLFDNYTTHHQVYDQTETGTVKSGLYDVDLVVLNNKDTIPALASDSLRWKNIAFEKNGYGSIDAYEPGFFPRYGRRYFNTKKDTTTGLLRFTSMRDTAQIYSMRYELPDDNTIRFWTKRGDDSVFMRLTRSKKHFQLTERQFHWLSESNR